MHHASHLLLQCIAFWCMISSGSTARNAVSPEILANFAKNVASVLSPAILGELQNRSNRSSFRDVVVVPTSDNDVNSPTDNIVDKTDTASYYQPRTYPYNELYERNTPTGLENSHNERLQGPLRDESYRSQERPNFYEPYDFSANSENFEATRKPIPQIANIDRSSSNQYSSYHGIGFHKAALAPEPYAGFGFGPYGHFPSFHHGPHRPYGGNGGNGGDEPPPSDDGGSAPEQNARLENNGTNYGGYGYGSPFFGNHGYYHPISPFPYGGYGPNHGPFYGGPYNGNGHNSSGNARNGYGYGPYHGGPDFYGSHGYGHGYNNGYGNGNSNGNSGSSRQTDGSPDDDQNNSTKNGYPRPYGPPLVKPLLGTFHLPTPFGLLPYDHFHGHFFKGGPVGIGHVGYPIYADPYPIGFPFLYPYGPIFHGKKYLPPKDKPADPGESAEMTQAPPAGELTESGNPERISALSDEVVAPAPSSNRFKTSARKGSKRVNLTNVDSQKG